MSVGFRVPRVAPWRLMLFMVLAGLLHLLGCAHGPQAAGLYRADTPIAAVDTHPAQPGITLVGDAPVLSHGEGTAACTGGDEPAAAGPRVDLPAPPATAALPLVAERCAGQTGGGPAWWRSRDEALHDAYGRVRAALGVWRT